ncbi:MAG: hypothetical protein ACK4N5_22790, partial [Myxococcales bacterium]
SSYTLDLFGHVIFHAPLALGADVRVASAAYLPLLTVGTARKASVKRNNNLVDVTKFGQGARHHLATLRSAEGDLEGFDTLKVDHDPGLGSCTFASLLENGTPFLIEFAPGGGSFVFRAWALLESPELSDEVEDVVVSTIAWKSAAQSRTGRNDVASFGWGTP